MKVTRPLQPATLPQEPEKSRRCQRIIAWPGWSRGRCR